MNTFATLKTSKKIVPIAIIRDGKFRYINLELDRIDWLEVMSFEKKYNAKINVNAGGQSFNVKFN